MRLEEDCYVEGSEGLLNVRNGNAKERSQSRRHGRLPEVDVPLLLDQHLERRCLERKAEEIQVAIHLRLGAQNVPDQSDVLHSATDMSSEHLVHNRKKTTRQCQTHPEMNIELSASLASMFLCVLIDFEPI